MEPKQVLKDFNNYIQKVLEHKYGQIVVGSLYSHGVCFRCSSIKIKQNEAGLYLPSCSVVSNCITLEIGIPFTSTQLYEEHFKEGKSLKDEFKIEREIREVAKEACDNYGLRLRNLSVIPIGDFKGNLTEIQETMFGAGTDFEILLPKELETLETTKKQ